MINNKTENETGEIKITRPLAMHLLGIAQKSPQHEVCGLVAMHNDKPSTVYPIKNIAAQAETEFEMHAEEQIAAFKSMRDKDEQLFAIYHSHPDSPPVPSVKDLEQVGYPDAYYLIISLTIKGVLEMRAYKLNGDEVEHVDLTV